MWRRRLLLVFIVVLVVLVVVVVEELEFWFLPVSFASAALVPKTSARTSAIAGPNLLLMFLLSPSGLVTVDHLMVLIEAPDGATVSHHP